MFVVLKTLMIKVIEDDVKNSFVDEINVDFHIDFKLKSLFLSRMIWLFFYIELNL